MTTTAFEIGGKPLPISATKLRFMFCIAMKKSSMSVNLALETIDFCLVSVTTELTV